MKIYKQDYLGGLKILKDLALKKHKYFDTTNSKFKIINILLSSQNACTLFWEYVAKEQSSLERLLNCSFFYEVNHGINTYCFNWSGTMQGTTFWSNVEFQIGQILSKHGLSLYSDFREYPTIEVEWYD